MSESSEAEFIEDFGTSLKAADLARLLERARAKGDTELRQLVKQHQALRQTAADVVALLKERGEPIPTTFSASGPPVSYPIGALAWFVHDEPPPTRG